MTESATVDDFMAIDFITVTPDMDIHRAIELLVDHKISGMPVIDDAGSLSGFLSVKDCLRIAFGASYHQDWAGKVSEFMSADVQTIDSGTNIVEAAEIFLKNKFRIYPVVAGGRMVGVISRYDVLRALRELWHEGSAEQVEKGQE